MSQLLDASQTAARLPYPELAREIDALLRDPAVQVPARLVQALPRGASLFVMPAFDGRIAITKLITFTPDNRGTGRPTIQGDVVVFDVATGQRVGVIDGPVVTARRTAAVSLCAAQALAPEPAGPLLIVGAGAQGRAHLEAFAAGLALREVRVASRSAGSVQALVDHARRLGLQATPCTDVDAAMRECPLVVTCTPADSVVLRALPRADTFMAAVGAFTPQMIELAPIVCRHVMEHGKVVLDSESARHEAGDLLQAGVDVARCPTLAEVLGNLASRPSGPVLFKSCGWAGWDLAAARLAFPG